ncbi:MAG: hypothetical protein WC521_02485 [Bdellovibrionales bacterium]
MFSLRVIYPNFGSKGNKAPAKEYRAYSAQEEKSPPSKKPVCVMHPENAPRMIRDSGFPRDFQFYEYAGATLEVLPTVGLNGKTIRRPALVAKMIHRSKMEDGNALVEVEMTASLSDLRKERHPDAEAIAAALKMYYEEKVEIRERALRKQPAVTQKTTPVAVQAAQAPVNDFFMRMNSPLPQATQAR